jgi:hypothetical protein
MIQMSQSSKAIKVLLSLLTLEQEIKLSGDVASYPTRTETSTEDLV